MIWRAMLGSLIVAFVLGPFATSAYSDEISSGLWLAQHPLVALERNRASIVQRVAGEWVEVLPTLAPDRRMTREQLSEALFGLRSDRLLAASLAGSFAAIEALLADAREEAAAASRPARVAAKALGSVGADVTYTPVNPCRIADTRVAGGALAAGLPRTFDGYNASSFAFQGGTASNCGMPNGVAAIAMNVYAVNPTSLGFIKVWPANGAEPAVSTVNYQTGIVAIATGAIVPVDTTNSNRFIAKSPATVDFIADVVGYFRPPLNPTTGAFEVALGGNLAFQVQPDATSPIVIAGSSANSVTAGASGAVISGGGAPGTQVTYVGLGTVNCTNPPGGPCANRVTDAFGTVGGGIANQAGDGVGTNGDKPVATVGGGIFNIASGFASTIGGGDANLASGDASFVGGGFLNKATNVQSSAAGGFKNTASGFYSTVAGGDTNSAAAQHSFIGGGVSNMATGLWSAVAGGDQNTAGGDGSFVGGGIQNSANGVGGAVGGGNLTHADGDYSTVGGGSGNAAVGKFSTVPGGAGNLASQDYTFAAGRQSKAVATGTFALSDSTALNFLIAAPNYFGARFTGGFMFATGVDAGGSFLTGCTLPGGGGTFSCTSDRATKTDFAEVDAKDVLARVAALPITEWRFHGEPENVRHMGPVAQDFRAAFGLGYDDKSIGVQDAQGVALAAIQGLNAELARRDATIAHQGQEIAKQNSEIAELWCILTRFARIGISTPIRRVCRAGGRPGPFGQ